MTAVCSRCSCSHASGSLLGPRVWSGCGLKGEEASLCPGGKPPVPGTWSDDRQANRDSECVSGSTNRLSPSEPRHPQLPGRFLQSRPACRALGRRARSSRPSAARPEHPRASGRPHRWLARPAAAPSPARQARRSGARPKRQTAPVAGLVQQSSRVARSRSSPRRFVYDPAGERPVGRASHMNGRPITS